MKKILFLLLCLAFFFQCKKDVANPPETIGVTESEVLEIARKYGLEDSILVGAKPVMGKPIPPEAYPHFKKEWVERYCSTWRNNVTNFIEMKIYLSKICDVYSLDEYFMLIESLPAWHKRSVESEGGPENYIKWKKRMYAERDVYLDKECVPVYIEPGDDLGITEGWRLLHKAKSR